MLPVPYLRDSRVIVTCPINLASSKKGLQLLSSFHYYFCLSYFFDRPRTGAEVGRFECFVFIFLALRFVSVFWDSNFLKFLRVIDSC